MKKLQKFLDSVMPVFSLLLLGLIVTILIASFYEVSRFFILFAGFILGFEVSNRINDRIIRGYKRIVDGYNGLLSDISKAIKKAEKEAQEKAIKDLKVVKKPRKKSAVN